jgi:L-lactate dehydrogenase
MRGIASQVVVLDKNHACAKAAVADLQYGATLSPAVELLVGDYTELAGAVLVIVRSGSVKRVAAALGEWSIAISLVHRGLAEL